MSLEELEEVECYTAVVFWNSLKDSAKVIRFIKNNCNGKHLYMMRSLERLWICDSPQGESSAEEAHKT